MEIKTYQLTTSDLENVIDDAKTAIVRALVTEGLLDAGVADAWCETHMTLLRNKPFFRTLTDKWRKEPESEHDFLIVVERVK